MGEGSTLLLNLRKMKSFGRYTRSGKLKNGALWLAVWKPNSICPGVRESNVEKGIRYCSHRWYNQLSPSVIQNKEWTGEE